MSETTSGYGTGGAAETRTETRVVARKATAEEQAAAGVQLVGLLDLEDAVLKEKKNAVDAFNDRLEEVRGQVGAKRTTIREGTVAEEVEVSITYDANRASVTEARLDTGEVLRDRAMTAEELDAGRQLNLAPPPAPPLPFPGTPTSTDDPRMFRHVDGHDTFLGVVCREKGCTCEGDAIAAGIDPADLVDEKGGDDAGPRF